MATYSSILTWRIPWTEEPGGLQSMGSQRVRHNWATKQQQHSHSGQRGNTAASTRSGLPSCVTLERLLRLSGSLHPGGSYVSEVLWGPGELALSDVTWRSSPHTVDPASCGPGASFHRTLTLFRLCQPTAPLLIAAFEKMSASHSKKIVWKQSGHLQVDTPSYPGCFQQLLNTSENKCLLL